MPNAKRRTSRSGNSIRKSSQPLSPRRSTSRAKGKVPILPIKAVQNIQEIDITDLKPAPYNPRVMSESAMAGLTQSLRRFGLVEPIIWNKRSGYVVGGHQRLKVLQTEGVERAQVVVIDIDDSEEKHLNIALNNLSGEWDYDALKKLLAELQPDGKDAELLGFSSEELSTLLKWGEEMSAAPGGAPDAGIGLTPDERLAVYENNTIKQIVLYFESEKYIDVLKRMKEIAEGQEPKLETNSDIFEHLLNFYEKNSRTKKAR